MQDRPDAAAFLRLQRDRLAVLRSVYPLRLDDTALVVVPEAVFVVRGWKIVVRGSWFVVRGWKIVVRGWKIEVRGRGLGGFDRINRIYRIGRIGSV